MIPGRMDRRVIIQSLTETTDSFGQLVQSWSTLATVWAEKTDLKGREYFAAAQVNAEITTRFRMRYRSDVTPLNRLVTADSREYDILSVAETGRRDGLEIMAKARV